MRDENREILDPLLLRLKNGHRVAGAVVSKPMAKKTTFLLGFARAIFKQSIGE